MNRSVKFEVALFLPNGSTELLALLGTELSQSPSPATHSEWARLANLNWIYLPMTCRDEAGFHSLAEALMGCRDFRGANITNPFKTSALRLPGVSIDSSAELCGAANTLYRGDDTAKPDWRLANTDVVGCSESIQKILNYDRPLSIPKDKILFVIFGSGAMARTCCVAIEQLESFAHSKQTIKLSRTELELRKFDAICSFKPNSLVVINTLPTGTSPEADLLAFQTIETLDRLNVSARKYLFEVSYIKTKSCQLARSLLWTIVEGDVLFETQARASFKLWARRPSPTQATALTLSGE